MRRIYLGIATVLLSVGIGGIPFWYRPELVQGEYAPIRSQVRDKINEEALEEIVRGNEPPLQKKQRREMAKGYEQPAEPESPDFLQKTLEALEETHPEYELVDEEKGEVKVNYGDQEPRISLQLTLDQETGLARDLFLVISQKERAPIYATAWSIYAEQGELPRILEEIKTKATEENPGTQITSFLAEEIEKGGGYLNLFDLHPP